MENTISDKIDIKEIEDVVRKAADIFADRDEAGRVHIKGASDYVTDVDFHVQRFLNEKLTLMYPQIQFMGEEKDNGSIDFSGAVWILDPVDGTTNLIHDMRASVISLGLAVNRNMEIGIIYWLYMDEMFTACRGQGAFLNGRPIHVSQAEILSDSLISIGTSPYYPEYTDWTFDAAKAVFDAAQDIRRSGSAALELCYVACGRLDGTFERILSPWDFAAGLLIVEEAGGKVRDIDGSLVDITAKSGILASNGIIQDELEKLLKSIDK